MPDIKDDERIVDFLIKGKVLFIFGIYGQGNAGILDALYDQKDEIRLIALATARHADRIARPSF